MRLQNVAAINRKSCHGRDVKMPRRFPRGGASKLQISCASPSVANRCSFRHSSQYRPLNESLTSFPIGLPGVMECSSTRRSRIDKAIAMLVSTVPFSTTMDCEEPEPDESYRARERSDSGSAYRLRLPGFPRLKPSTMLRATMLRVRILRPSATEFMHDVERPTPIDMSDGRRAGPPRGLTRPIDRFPWFGKLAASRQLLDDFNRSRQRPNRRRRRLRPLQSRSRLPYPTSKQDRLRLLTHAHRSERSSGSRMCAPATR